MVEKVYQNLAKVIVRRRLEAGITQEVLAKKACISRPTLANIEAGRQRIVVHRLLQLEKALGLGKGMLLLLACGK